MYGGDDKTDDSKLFICERYALTDLLQGLKSPCSCGMSSSPWALESTVQASYCVTLLLIIKRVI